MDRSIMAFCLLCCSVLLVAGCRTQQHQSVELKRYPLDSLEGVIGRSEVELDPAISSDGKGSLRVTAAAPLTVRLFVTGDIPVDNGRLIYQARLRCEKLQGQAYLESGAAFRERENFSRVRCTPPSREPLNGHHRKPLFHSSRARIRTK